MSERTATLYRMKLPTHECPYGLRAKEMLEQAGFDIDEHLLTTRDEVDARRQALHGSRRRGAGHDLREDADVAR